MIEPHTCMPFDDRNRSRCGPRLPDVGEGQGSTRRAGVAPASASTGLPHAPRDLAAGGRALAETEGVQQLVDE
jgi:hypothetical protein